MSFSLFGNPLGKAIVDALAGAKVSADIAAAVPPRLSKYLQGQGVEHVEVSTPGNASGAARYRAILLVDTVDDEESLRAWRDHLVDGGLLLLAQKADAPECSRRMLCAGYTMPEQLEVGRRVLTLGRSTDWTAA